MAEMTLAQLIELRDAYLVAEKEVLKMKAWEVGGKKFTMENLSEIKAERKALDKQISIRSNGDTTLYASFVRPE